MTQTQKGLRHLRRGLKRFARERPVITSFVLLGCAALIWQTFAGRS